jgi:hypothetical protein
MELTENSYDVINEVLIRSIILGSTVDIVINPHSSDLNRGAMEP